MYAPSNYDINPADPIINFIVVQGEQEVQEGSVDGNGNPALTEPTTANSDSSASVSVGNTSLDTSVDTSSDSRQWRI